jgi:uncharacterized protein (DUF1330 family)
MMVYYTQLIFLRDGKEGVFQRYEDQVLPLLPKHRGRLLYRVRPSAGDVIATSVGRPYEVHLVSFESQEDFDAFANDSERRRYLPLKDESVASAILIEGQAI